MPSINLFPLLRTALLLVCCGAVTACIEQSRVQGRYIDAQEDCRSTAEDAVAKLPNSGRMTPDQHSAEVVNQFSICMNKAGWHVANPLKPKGDKAAAAAEAGAAAKPAAGTTPTPATAAPTNTAPTLAGPTLGSKSSQPDDIAPPAQYERTIDAPTGANGDAGNGRQF